MICSVILKRNLNLLLIFFSPQYNHLTNNNLNNTDFICMSDQRKILYFRPKIVCAHDFFIK